MEYRSLPGVENLMSTPLLAKASSIYRREWVVNLVRLQLEKTRHDIRAGGTAPSAGEIAQAVSTTLESFSSPWPKPVINATGVIIHTNLGRAPLSHSTVRVMERVAQGYVNLEIDLGHGRRGSRQGHLQPLLQELTGAETALVVNNNASAVLLGLSALASGKEVIVSRGEAVEIGGGFRIPDVLRQSGATLVEVGTTNRTYARDYEQAITENTAVLLKVHASNFRIQGFTAAVEPKDLVDLGQRYGIPVLHDVGSGCLLETAKYGLAHEPTPQESIGSGVQLVFFSGDKLLGGPQAGVIVGQKRLVQQLEKHPLARAVRIDKLSLAGLTATFLHYLRGEAEGEIPIWRMVSASAESIKARAQRWQSEIKCTTLIVPTNSAIGGGSLPGETLPSWALVLPGQQFAGGAEEVSRRLRSSATPVVARIESDQIFLDPRTVGQDEDEALLQTVRAVLEAV